MASFLSLFCFNDLFFVIFCDTSFSSYFLSCLKFRLFTRFSHASWEPEWIGNYSIFSFNSWNSSSQWLAWEDLAILVFFLVFFYCSVLFISMKYHKLVPHRNSELILKHSVSFGFCHFYCQIFSEISKIGSNSKAWTGFFYFEFSPQKPIFRFFL